MNRQPDDWRKRHLVMILTIICGLVISSVWLTIFLPRQLRVISNDAAVKQASPNDSPLALPPFPAVLSWIDRQRLLATPTPTSMPIASLPAGQAGPSPTAVISVAPTPSVTPTPTPSSEPTITPESRPVDYAP